MTPPPPSTVPDFTGVFSLLRGDPAKGRRKKIGRLVATGHCDEARQIALKAGDFDAANYVNNACVASQ